jgi:hypothetical protein
MDAFIGKILSLSAIAEDKLTDSDRAKGHKVKAIVERELEHVIDGKKFKEVLHYAVKSAEVIPVAMIGQRVFIEGVVWDFEGKRGVSNATLTKLGDLK